MKRTAKHAPGSVVFDRRRGQWQYFWYESGHRHSKTLGGRDEYPTKAAAWKAVESMRRQSTASELAPTSETVNQVIERFKAERMSHRHSHRRVSCSFLKTHIVPRWGDTPIGNLEAREVELWLRELKRAPKTKSHLRSLLSTLVEFAMWAKLIPLGRNPISLVRVKGAAKRSLKPRSLTVDEFHKLSDELREPFQTIALVCVCLGLRISEAMGLHWSDINWLESTLNVRRAIVERHVDETKTVGSAATFPLSGELLSKLMIRRQLTEFPGEEDWIYASPVKIGRLPYSYTGVWRELQRAAIAAGLGKMGTHTFRHTYRSWLDSVGTDLAVQQKAMRHSDIRTTMNYGGVVDGRMDQALQKVSGLAFANSTHNSTQAS